MRLMCIADTPRPPSPARDDGRRGKLLPSAPDTTKAAIDGIVDSMVFSAD